jgi:hypothetical protein
MIDARPLSDKDLIDRLRRCGAVWFKNDDIMLLEELIRRYERKREPVNA